MAAALGPVQLPARLGFLKAPWARVAVDVLSIVTIGVGLSYWLNVRYPLPASAESDLQLAIEVPVAFAALALARRVGLRLGFWWFFLPAGLLALAVRVFLVADNISHRYLYRDFRIPLDLQQKVWPTEDFELARSLVDSPIPESDLFAGVHESVDAESAGSASLRGRSPLLG